MKVYVAGNCQAGVLCRLVESLTGLPAKRLTRERAANLQKSPMPDKPRVIFAQSACRSWVEGNVILFPRIVTTSFHPDVLLFNDRADLQVQSPLLHLNSSIVLKAWCEGLSARETLALFNSATFEKLGFFEYFEIGKAQLLAEGDAVGLPLDALFEKWLSNGCFMHAINHPKVEVMLDIAKILLDRAGLAWKEPQEAVKDFQASGMGWPFYPHLAERVGLAGNYEFRTHVRHGGRVLDLVEFVEQSFEMYAEQRLERVPCSDRLTSHRYENLRNMLPVVPGRHPYVGLPEHQFWRKAVHGDVDPVTSSFVIRRNMRVATAGSCFAQHISRALQAEGLNYFVAETDPGNAGSNYGVFSARYGNIYTARQLLQLFDRAYGRYEPVDVAWTKGSAFVDPFRPEIEPKGFSTVETLGESRTVHFQAVRRMFEDLDVFVFTLGLTEAWRAKHDGAVFPLAPGVSGGTFDPDVYEFVNFGVSDVTRDLNDFLDRLASVNARARVILTVSPVPLAATFERQHVLVSTIYSKSVLRVAAQDVAQNRANVWYFPSYEIVTGSFNRGRYFADDLRTVTPDAVGHVMRMFLKHFTADKEIEASARRAMDLVCEEERLLAPD